MKRKYTYECKEISSYKIFMQFVEYKELGLGGLQEAEIEVSAEKKIQKVEKSCNASKILSKECYDTWLSSRRKAPKRPMEAFRRALTAHCRGVDGRRPFPEEVEKSLLQELRKKQSWECFRNLTDGSESGHIGVQGFPSLGYHEKKNLVSGMPTSVSSATLPHSFQSQSSFQSGESQFVKDYLKEIRLHNDSKGHKSYSSDEERSPKKLKTENLLKRNSDSFSIANNVNQQSLAAINLGLGNLNLQNQDLLKLLPLIHLNNLVSNVTANYFSMIDNNTVKSTPNFNNCAPWNLNQANLLEQLQQHSLKQNVTGINTNEHDNTIMQQALLEMFRRSQTGGIVNDV